MVQPLQEEPIRPLEREDEVDLAPPARELLREIERVTAHARTTGFDNKEYF
jgi:hypothetical protein